MALHVPKAPGFQSMMKDGSKFFSGVEEAVIRNIGKILFCSYIFNNHQLHMFFPNWLKLFQIVLNVSKLVEMCPNLFKPIHISFNLSKLVETYSNLSEIVQMSQNLF